MDKKLTFGLIGLGVLTSGFAFAKRRKADPSKDFTDAETTDPTTKRKTVMAHEYTLNGKKIRVNEYLFARQERIPLVAEPDQQADAKITLDKGEKVGQFTGKVVTDYKYIPEGHVFLEIVRQGKKYFASIYHVEAA